MEMDNANEEYREALAQAGQLCIITPNSKLMSNRGSAEGIARSARDCTGTTTDRPFNSYKFAVDGMTVPEKRGEAMSERQRGRAIRPASVVECHNQCIHPMKA